VLNFFRYGDAFGNRGLLALALRGLRAAAADLRRFAIVTLQRSARAST